jgi:ribosomal protein S18 acetylase RimI-like enzyme
MQQLLDNPVWHALCGRHAHLAIGRGLARYYPRNIAPFSAIAEATAEAYADVLVALPHGTETRLFRPSEEPTPAGWETMSSQPIIQMVADQSVRDDAALGERLIELGVSDAHDMLQLVEITKPSPLGPHTHMLGAYVGYRDRGKLIAMGGQRFRPPGLVELSATRVHPDARGCGLGTAVTTHLSRLARAHRETPFLRVFPDNPATALYERLGFRERARVWVIWRRVRSLV